MNKNQVDKVKEIIISEFTKFKWDFVPVVEIKESEYSKSHYGVGAQT